MTRRSPFGARREVISHPVGDEVPWLTAVTPPRPGIAPASHSFRSRCDFCRRSSRRDATPRPSARPRFETPAGWAWRSASASDSTSRAAPARPRTVVARAQRVPSERRTSCSHTHSPRRGTAQQTSAHPQCLQRASSPMVIDLLSDGPLVDRREPRAMHHARSKSPRRKSRRTADGSHDPKGPSM